MAVGTLPSSLSLSLSLSLSWRSPMPAELFLVMSLYNSNQCGNTVHLTKLQLSLPRPFFPSLLHAGLVPPR